MLLSLLPETLVKLPYILELLKMMVPIYVIPSIIPSVLLDPTKDLLILLFFSFNHSSLNNKTYYLCIHYLCLVLSSTYYYYLLFIVLSLSYYYFIPVKARGSTWPHFSANKPYIIITHTHICIYIYEYVITYKYL